MPTEEKKNLKLENHLILYIDILGYRQQIEAHGEDKFLAMIDDSFERVMSFVKMDNINEDFEFKYKIFSDNIIVSLRFTGINVYVMDFLNTAQMIQKGFIARNILIRGAITIGNLYIDDNYVYGSGLIKAYELESKYAISPRIIIDHETYGFLMNFPESKFIIRAFREDDDGYFFIDYLYPGINNSSLKNYFMFDFIKTHRDYITEKISEFKKDDYVMQKYLWCKEYHNKICEKEASSEYYITS